MKRVNRREVLRSVRAAVLGAALGLALAGLVGGSGRVDSTGR
jgi:hypothetical protein